MPETGKTVFYEQGHSDLVRKDGLLPVSSSNVFNSIHAYFYLMNKKQGM